MSCDVCDDAAVDVGFGVVGVCEPQAKAPSFEYVLGVLVLDLGVLAAVVLGLCDAVD